jgi:probable rRNA maturation factor
VENDYPVDTEAIHRAAWHALHVGGVEEAIAIGVTVTTQEHVHGLNLQFAGKDEPTDVLSFAAEDEDYHVEPGDPPYFGDVIIAYPIAEKQANEAGHSITNELQMLTIHGSLHLIGYDHHTPEDKAMMWALQSAAMDALREE